MRGRLTVSASQAIPERLELTVPRWDGRDWRPGVDPEHPLARFGQELQVSIRAGSSATTQTWETRVGRFLVTDWNDAAGGGAVHVSASGLLRRVQDDRLTAPSQPGSSATLLSEARRLLPPGMSASFDAALVDRACPAGMSWSEDRLAALQEIADAWPALLRTDEWGQVSFRPPLPATPSPVLNFADGVRGTVVSAPRSDTRDGAYSRVVARSSNTATADVQAIADQASGPTRTDGPYGAVTRVWSSPLLRDGTEALAAAQTMLRNSTLPAQILPVTCAPDPRIDLGDAVEVIFDGERTWGWVVGYDLPLTVDDGPMRVDVGVAA